MKSLKREFRGTRWRVSTEQVAAPLDVEQWLLKKAFAPGLLILAHADDGVIWGRLAGGKLLTSSGQFPGRGLPTLQAATLRECRMFGPAGECLLWRAAESWLCRLVLDGQNQEDEPVEYFDEDQILWGTQVEAAGPAGHDFTLVSDGVEGLLHAVPIAAQDIPFDPMQVRAKRRPLRLTVRHYLGHDALDGTVFIAGSRLVKLHTEAPTTGGESDAAS